VNRLRVLVVVLLGAAVVGGLATGCGASPEVDLDIELPPDPGKTLFAAVTSLDLTATRNGVVLAHGTFSSTAGTVSLAGVSHGANTIFTLEGLSSGSVIAEGRTCAVDFEGPGTTAPLYFAPTLSFAPTKGAPTSERANSVAVTLDDGTALLAGGTDTTGAVLATSDLFTPGVAQFESAAAMHVARTRAQATLITSIGALVTGGLGADGGALAAGEIYLESSKLFVPASVPALDARVDHRTVLLDDGSVFLSGGSASDGGAPLATTKIVIVASDGTFQVNDGPNLVEARRAHAVTVAVGVPLVFGGYGAAGTPLASIEYVDLAAAVPSAQTIATPLTTARAEATATVLASGSILVVGGRGPAGAPLTSAELYNPVTREITTTYTLAVARYGHTATLLADGRVLVAGGYGADGKALASVELFEPDVGFVTERSLEVARAGHVAVPVCDGTVLVAGGGAGAELYFGAAD